MHRMDELELTLSKTGEGLVQVLAAFFRQLKWLTDNSLLSQVLAPYKLHVRGKRVAKCLLSYIHLRSHKSTIGMLPDPRTSLTQDL